MPKRQLYSGSHSMSYFFLAKALLQFFDIMGFFQNLQDYEICKTTSELLLKDVCNINFIKPILTYSYPCITREPIQAIS